MKLKANIKLALASQMLLFAIPVQASAHTSGNTGGESVQWILDMYNHAGTISIPYNININVSYTHASLIKQGASRWNSVGPVSFST